MLAALLVALLGGGSFVPVPTGTEAPTCEVARGDSLSVIARRFDTTAQNLRDWNGLEGDLIVPGQRLRVGAEPGRAPAWRVLASRLSGRAAVEVPAPAPEVDSSPGRRRAHRAAPAAPPPRSVDADLVTRWAPLTLPAAKPCLDETTGIDGSFGRSQGLEPGQVRAVVSSFQEQTLRCYTAGVEAAGEVVLLIAVGCDGRVRRSAVRRDDAGDSDFASCVADAFRYAPFPAHARDEVELVVPLHFTAP